MKFLKVMNIFYKRADFGFLLNCAYVLMKAVPHLSAGDFGLWLAKAPNHLLVPLSAERSDKNRYVSWNGVVP